jgi:hypothetical protein
MPVGTTAYQQASVALNGARACLNDINALLFSDSVLFNYMNIAYRQVQRALSVAGNPLFIVDDVYFLNLPAVVTPDPAIHVSLTDAGWNNGTTLTNPPQLPTDLLEPVKLFSRATGTQNDYQEMTDLTEHGGLPSVPQSNLMGSFEWRSDGLFFIGATSGNDLRLRYKKSFPDLVTATDPIQIRQGADCIGFITAGLASMARGSPLADKWAQAGETALEALVQAATRRDQNNVRRRRPNSSRTGGYWAGWSSWQSRQ